MVTVAIGQLADYGRFVTPLDGRAVLLESRPRPDLEALLTSLGINAIWREASSFVDNAGGAFV